MVKLLSGCSSLLFTKKNSVFERNIKFNTVVDKGERSAGDEDDDEEEDEEKARDVFLEKRRRTP